MNMRNLYLLMAGILLAGFTSCKKSETPVKVTGNDTVKTVKGVDVPAGDGDGVTFIS